MIGVHEVLAHLASLAMKDMTTSTAIGDIMPMQSAIMDPVPTDRYREPQPVVSLHSKAIRDRSTRNHRHIIIIW